MTPAAALVAPARTRIGYSIQVALFALLILGSGTVAFALRGLHGDAPPLWPPFGVALAGLLLLGLRAWPGVLLAALVLNHLQGLPPLAALVLSVGNTLSVVLPAWLLQRSRFTFDRLAGVGRYLLYAGLLGSTLDGLATLAGVSLWEDANHGYPFVYFSSVALAAAVTSLVVAAPLVAWLGPRPAERPTGRGWELLVLAGGIGGALLLIHASTPFYALLAFPLMTWASLRFGARGATGLTVASYLLSLFGMGQGLPLLDPGMLELQVFFTLLHFAIGGTGLLLAASAAERQRAQAQEYRADDQYRALLAASPLAIVGLDRAGRVSLWSAAAEQLFGWPAAEVIGGPPPTIPPERAEEFAAILAGRTEPLLGLETLRWRRDGTRIDVVLHTWPLRDADGSFAGSVGALQDITERKRAEQLQAALFRISQAALLAEDLDSLYAAIHGIVSGLMPARNFYIATYEAATDTLSFPYWVDQHDPRPAPRRARNGLTEYVLRSGRPLRDRHTTIGSLEARGDVEVVGTPAADWLGVPLQVAGTVMGVLVVQSYDQGVQYSDRDQGILEFVSNQVAMAIDRRRAAAAQQATAVELEALFAAMPDVIVVFDRDGTFLKVAPTRQEYRFSSPQEVIGKRMAEVLPPALAAEATQAVRTALERREAVTIEYELPIRGVPHWFSGTASPMGPDRAVWVARNITPVKESQLLERVVGAVARAAVERTDLHDTLAELHRTIAALMPARSCYVALVDAGEERLIFPYWSDERLPNPRYRPRGQSYSDWVLTHGRPLRYRQSLVTGEPPAAEATFVGPEPADWMAAPLTVGDRTLGVVAVQTYEGAHVYSAREQQLLEIVASQVAFLIERTRAAELVRRSEERFRALAATTSDVIYEWDPVARREWWSENITAILGYQPGEIRFSDDGWEQLLHEEDRARASGTYAAAATGTATSWREEYRIRRRDGSYAWVLDRARLERDAAGRVTRVIGAMLDITSLREAREALRRSEDQLRQAAKMEAVGRLAGGVAHDFNNLLTSVLGHADLALGTLDTGHPVRDDLQEIKAAGTRAAALTQQLLAFSRKQLLEPRVLDLNAVVSGTIKMLRRTIGEDVTLVTRLAPDLGHVRADPVQMEQVLINLAVNARDAMPDGGRLLIETTNVRLPVGPGVRIRVQDDGVGMSEEVRRHVFEPFFTTKDVGKGTGLGLATAYGIVEQSGGTITVSSALGEGATFQIDLPQVGAEDPPPVLPASTALPSGSETVLVVEDEEAVRNLTRRVLEQHGYVVLSAPSGESALELARAHAGAIHVLLTDVVMPGISGPRLAEILLAERQGLCCLFMSGYAASAVGSSPLLQGETRFLQKPFTTTQLLQRLRETLAAADRPA
ncbi:MAG: PAS domain S-box protein [Gemmatimonadetes bacterium]|nr:PAS domain S-box protein [Gemmatimonadota bacterium]